MIPVGERPSPEALVGEKPPTPGPDYSDVRLERGYFLTKWHRQQEQKRSGGDKQPLYGHEEPEEISPIPSGREPFDPRVGSLEEMVHSIRRRH